MFIEIFKISQNSQETPVPEETPVNFAKSLGTRRLLLKWGHCKNETREIDCLCSKEVDAMLIASTKIPEYEGSMAIQLLWRSALLIVS